jgi:hypothetical protein
MWRAVLLRTLFLGTLSQIVAASKDFWVKIPIGQAPVGRNKVTVATERPMPLTAVNATWIWGLGPLSIPLLLALNGWILLMPPW